MAGRIIFTVNVDIDEANLDNPGWWNRDGSQASTDKSKNTKEAFLTWSDRIISNHSKYAEICEAEYKVHTADEEYKTFFDNFAKVHPQISEYDIINFYKQLTKKFLVNFF